MKLCLKHKCQYCSNCPSHRTFLASLHLYSLSKLSVELQTCSSEDTVHSYLKRGDPESLLIVLPLQI